MNGFDIHQDCLYENFRIPYISPKNNSDRTYCPDFYVPKLNVVNEVKPFYAIDNNENKAKFAAANDFLSIRGIKFKVMTEKDFIKISFNEAIEDKDVVWKEKTFEYFKRK